MRRSTRALGPYQGNIKDRIMAAALAEVKGKTHRIQISHSILTDACGFSIGKKGEGYACSRSCG